MSDKPWDDDRANRLLDTTLVVPEAAGDWETPDEGYSEDTARLLRLAELYFSEGVRQKIWPHVDLTNQGIATGDQSPSALRAFSSTWCEV